jgi:hypothetical protein
VKSLCLALLCAALLLGLVACGSGNSTDKNKNTPPPTLASVSISPSSPFIAMGTTQQFTATAKDSSGTPMTGVTFTWASSATSVATINSSGLATAVSAGTTQITASASGVISSADTLTVTDPVATISVSPSSPSIAVNVTQQFTATAKDSGGNTLSGITFTWASSATGVATIDSSGLATGLSAGTTQITASASGVTSSNDTLTVTQQSSGGCTPGGSESLLNGGYAFLLKGFDASGNPALVIGALTFDGAGAITAGSIDANLNSGVEPNVSVSSGCYQVGTDQRGLMVLNTSSTSSPTQTYRFSVNNFGTTGHMIDFDSTGPFTTGVMRKQSGSPFSKASLNGSYAFGGSSLQNSAVCTAPCKFGIAGVVSFDGSGGVSGGSEDFNANGVIDGNSANTTWPATPIPIDSGTNGYSVSANGRTTLALSFAGGSSSANNILYLISSSEVFFMNADPQTTGTINAGTALLQSGAPFAANPLSGSYIGYDSGMGLTNGGATPGGGRTDLFLLGPLTAGNNALAGVQYRNNGGTFSSGGFAGSTYSVSPIGRSITAGGGGHAPLLYLVSTSHAFYLQNNLSVDDGFFELQSGAPFSDSSANGTFAIGYIDPEMPSISAVSGVAVFTPGSSSDSVSAILDGNISGTQTVDQAESGNYSIDTTGLGLQPPGCSISVTPITCTSALYIISPTKLVDMDLTGTNTVILAGEQ